MMKRYLLSLLAFLLTVTVMLADTLKDVSVTLFPVYGQHGKGMTELNNTTLRVSGYISEKPELEFRQLESVSKWTDRVFTTSVGLDGAEKKSFEEIPCVMLKFTKPDAIAFGKFSEKFKGLKVLIYVCGNMHSSKTIAERIDSGLFSLRCSDENEQAKLVELLKTLVKSQKGEDSTTEDNKMNPRANQ